MKKTISIGLATVFAVAMASCSSKSIESQSIREYPSEIAGEDLLDDGLVKYCGRYYEDGGSVWFGLSCTGFEVNFEGSSVSAVLKGIWQNEVVGQGTQVPFIGVFVDGETDPLKAEKIEVYMKEDTSYTLVENLPYGKHSVRVLKLTETSCNKLALTKLTTDGKFAEAPKKSAISMEFYGDSVTCGYGVDFDTQTSFSTDSENATKTYAYLAATSLGADFSFISASGWGMKHGLGEDSAVPDWFDKADIRSDKPWDNAIHKPDIVVINLGANDNQYIIGNVGGSVDEIGSKIRMRDYLSAYKAFILKILSVYGRSTPVFCCYGTMGESNIYVPLENMLYDDFQDGGYPSVYPVKLSDGSLNGEKALHGHPNYKTHFDSAEILVKAITENTKFKTTGENV